MSALVMLGIPSGVAALMDPKMITPARRVDAKPSYAIPSRDGVQVDDDNRVILVRWLDRIYALTLACPQKHTPLKWNGTDEEFVCPRHHTTYRPDGTFIAGRGTHCMDRFDVSLLGNEIVVDVEAPHQPGAEPAAWAEAVVVLDGG